MNIVHTGILQYALQHTVSDCIFNRMLGWLIRASRDIKSCFYTCTYVALALLFKIDIG